MAVLAESRDTSVGIDGVMRNSWRAKEIEVLPHLSKDRINGHISKSIDSIFQLQDPQTGLTAAAPPGKRDTARHMDHWWMRDQAIKVLALSNGARELTEEGSEMRGSIDAFVEGSVRGMVSLLGQDAWQEGFEMPVKRNPYTGIRELKDSTKAPPIHARTNGDLDPDNSGSASWIAQNQPDAWGFLFQAVSQSIRNGIVNLDSGQKEKLEQAVSYITRIGPENLRQVSMWEWTEPGIPPTSSVAIVGKGLNDILPLIGNSELKGRVARRIQNCRDFVNSLYPKDYTDESQHYTTTDLATLIAMGHDALDGFSLTSYLRSAKKELMSPSMPGMIRYRGDQYHMNYEEPQGEAAWFLGLPYMATLYFKSAEKVASKGQMTTARLFYAKGAQNLSKAFDLVEEHEYPPELFEVQNGEYVVPGDGSSSHIGWNDAAIIQAGARALKLQKMFDI